MLVVATHRSRSMMAHGCVRAQCRLFNYVNFSNPVDGIVATPSSLSTRSIPDSWIG
jgi:hypothetical protein